MFICQPTSYILELKDYVKRLELKDYGTIKEDYSTKYVIGRK